MALRAAKRVWLATDCGCERLLISQEILEHYKYRGEACGCSLQHRTPERSKRLQPGKPSTDYGRLYAAAVARRQADQIYSLSLTRTATIILGQGKQGVIGVGRMKTPTLAIVCRREQETRNFVPDTYFEIIIAAKVACGQFHMLQAPKERILKRQITESIVEAAQDFEGPLNVRVEDKRRGPPKLHDLRSLQKYCSSRCGWTAAETLVIAQELYDGQGKKIMTYPRAEDRGRTSGR